MRFVYTGRPSRGASRLARAIGGRRIRDFSRVRDTDTVINWGDGKCPGRTINQAESVRRASNKLTAFDALKAASVSIPEYARSKDGVSWAGASATVVRHVLQGHSGEGIEIVEKESELPDAKLFVRYEPKNQEYRVHVIGDEVILVQRKGRNSEVPDDQVNWRVRNHSNGFVFVRNDITPPQGLEEAAKKSIQALGLDFGAVDLIVKKNGTVLVLEVNTAPGMEGSTVNDYAQGFSKLLQQDKRA